MALIATGGAMNQTLSLYFSVAACAIALVALFKEQAQQPFYLKIEVQYGTTNR